jgi:hypothetical protein
MKIRDRKIEKYAGIRCPCCATFGCTQTHKSKTIISRRSRRKQKQNNLKDLEELEAWIGT